MTMYDKEKIKIRNKKYSALVILKGRVFFIPEGNTLKSTLFGIQIFFILSPVTSLIVVR